MQSSCIIRLHNINTAIGYSIYSLNPKQLLWNWVLSKPLLSMVKKGWQHPKSVFITPLKFTLSLKENGKGYSILLPMHSHTPCSVSMGTAKPHLKSTHASCWWWCSYSPPVSSDRDVQPGIQPSWGICDRGKDYFGAKWTITKKKALILRFWWASGFPNLRVICFEIVYRWIELSFLSIYNEVLTPVHKVVLRSDLI